RRMELRPHSIRGRSRPRAYRVATSSSDRVATNLAVGTPQANRKSPRWRRAAPRGRPDTTPARRPHLPTQPGRRTPQNANSNTRPISFDRSFGPPIWRKNNAAVAGLCPRKGPGPVELGTVLNGRPAKKGPFAKETIARSVSPGFGDRPIKASSPASLHRTGDDGSENVTTRAPPSAAPARGAPARPRGGSGTAPPAAPRSRPRFRPSARRGPRFQPSGGNSACAGGAPRSPPRCAAAR